MPTNLNTKFKTSHLYLYFCVFLISFTIFKFILPYGDEPDYIYKYQFYIFNFESLQFFNTDDYSQAITCNKRNIIGSWIEPVMVIVPYFCNNTILDIIERVSIGFVLNILYFTLIFIIFKNKKLLKFLNLEKGFTDINMHILFCSLIYPSVIYHLGLRTNEVFLFYPILTFFLTWRNYIVSYSLALLALLIDAGNGIVFFLFISYFYLFRYIQSFIEIKKIVYFHILIFIYLILFQEMNRILLAYLFDLIGTDYTDSLSTYVIKNKQLYIMPNLFKLIVTYFSFIFFTPAYLKSTILFILMSCLLFYIFFVMIGFIKNKRYDFIVNNKFYYDYVLNCIPGVLFTLFVVLLIPAYSYIRYYLFIYPFVFSIIFLFFNHKITFLISLYATCFVCAEILLFRIFHYFLQDINHNPFFQ